jgi:hypothetical protein
MIIFHIWDTGKFHPGNKICWLQLYFILSVKLISCSTDIKDSINLIPMGFITHSTARVISPWYRWRKRQSDCVIYYKKWTEKRLIPDCNLVHVKRCIVKLRVIIENKIKVQKCISKICNMWVRNVIFAVISHRLLTISLRMWTS